MRKSIVGALATAAVAISAITLAWVSGRGIANETHERLSAVWPQLVEMPEEHRALLVWLAYQCKLAERPVSAAETVACLRQAAVTGAASAKFPTPDAQLERLLHRAGVSREDSTTKPLGA